MPVVRGLLSYPLTSRLRRAVPSRSLMPEGSGERDDEGRHLNLNLNLNLNLTCLDLT